MINYDIDKLESIVKSKLKEKRFKHSLNVAKLAKEIAKANGLDEQKAYIAGMLHDITKEMDEEIQNSILIENKDLDKLEYPFKTKHAYTAKYFIKNELNIDDEDILDAVYNHTICLSDKALAKIIYIADKREERRNINDGLAELAKTDLNEAYRRVNIDVKKYLESKSNERYIG